MRGRLERPGGTAVLEGLVGGGGEVIPKAEAPPSPTPGSRGLVSGGPCSTCCCWTSWPWMRLLIWGGKLAVAMWPGLARGCRPAAPAAAGLWGPRWWTVPPDCVGLRQSPLSDRDGSPRVLQLHLGARGHLGEAGALLKHKVPTTRWAQAHLPH